MLVDTCLYDVYNNLGTASWERWVFLNTHVGVHELFHKGDKLQIISIIQFNFAYADNSYTEGCVHIKINTNYNNSCFEIQILISTVYGLQDFVSSPFEPY